MKSRYTGLTRQAQDVFRREQEKRERNFAILMIKLVLYVAATALDFGRSRTERLWMKIENSIDEMHTDPVYWDRVDNLLIDKFGFDLPRCDTEFMQQVFYRPPELTEKEAEQAVAKMAKMKEFIEANGLPEREV